MDQEILRNDIVLFMPQLRLGSVAPDFEALTTHGRIRFHEWSRNAWAVLFSHPDDFTPVCTTELAEVTRRSAEFEKRGVKVIGLSANDITSHARWVKDIHALSLIHISEPTRRS